MCFVVPGLDEVVVPAQASNRWHGRHREVEGVGASAMGHEADVAEGEPKLKKTNKTQNKNTQNNTFTRTTKANKEATNFDSWFLRLTKETIQLQKLAPSSSTLEEVRRLEGQDRQHHRECQRSGFCARSLQGLAQVTGVGDAISP